MLDLERGVTPLTGSVDTRADVRCRGDVACGLSLRGRDVIIEGAAIRARVRARRDLTLWGGARGDFHGHCDLRAGRHLCARFADKAYLCAHGRLDLDHALHSHLLAHTLNLSGSLNGGLCRVHGQVCIGGDLGHPAYTPTSLHIGQPPLISHALTVCRQRLDKARQEAERLALFLPGHDNAPAARHSLHTALEQKLHHARRRSAALERQEGFLHGLLDCASLSGEAELIVRGTIHPGVSLHFGKARLDVDTPLTGARIRHENGVIRSCSV